MLRRPSEQQCYDIVKWSVQYLQDYGMHENSLFRESKSQHDIRNLKAQICEGRSRRQLGDLDCHVVGGVLVSALKDMPQALLFEIQDNLLEIADITDGNDEFLDRIAAYISLLPVAKIEVVRVLFTYLHDLATSPGNDASMVHLMIIFAPLFVKPSQTAHMSIRHVDMLRQLRPLLQTTLDNSVYVVRHIVANPTPSVAPVKDLAVHIDSHGSHRLAKSDTDRKRSSDELNLNLSINIGGLGNKCSNFSGADKKLGDESTSRGIPKMSVGIESNNDLRLNLGGAMDVVPDGGSELNVFSESSPLPPGLLIPYGGSGTGNSHHNAHSHTWEWKLLDSLVLSRVEALVHKNDLTTYWDSNKRKISGENTSPRQTASHDHVSTISFSSVRNSNDSGSEMEQDVDENNNDMVHNIQSSRLYDRRTLIAECKRLRHSIQQFEERWISEHKRSPKAHERGNMQQSYTRYKEIKKAIRDAAAVDLQRLVRGYICRKNQSSDTSGPMELDQHQQQQEYIQQSQFSHLQKRPASADGYHSSHTTSPLAKALAGSDVNVSLSTSLPLTRSVSDEGKSITSAMMDADPKSSQSHTTGVKQQHHAWLSNDQETSPRDESLNKQVQLSTGSKQSSNAGGKYSDEASALCKKYQDAVDSKKSLKKMLKKFDDDFVLKKGRAPKKADKEVMRPHYQKYHEVRGELEKLKSEIIKTLGHFPKELEESKQAATGVNDEGVHVADHQKRDTHGTNSSISSGASGKGLAKASDHVEDDDADDDDDHISGTSISSSHSQSHGQSNAHGRSSTGNEGSNITNSLGGLDELNHEKKHLHSYLKSFEKEFNRANGRHVMHPEDILPVAKEYQRYKELKKILKDYRASSSS